MGYVKRAQSLLLVKNWTVWAYKVIIVIDWNGELLKISMIHNYTWDRERFRKETVAKEKNKDDTATTGKEEK